MKDQGMAWIAAANSRMPFVAPLLVGAPLRFIGCAPDGARRKRRPYNQNNYAGARSVLLAILSLGAA